MDNLTKNMFVKMIDNLRFASKLISYLEIQESIQDKAFELKIKIQPINSSCILNYSSYGAVAYMYKIVNGIKVVRLGSNEIAVIFLIENELKKDMQIMVNDLNEIIRSYYNTDFIMSSSAVELLKMGDY